MLRTLARWLLGIAFIIAGTLHFTNTAFYEPMMPPWLPWHLPLIYLSGFFEVAGGVGVLIPRTRRWAGWGLIALLIAVFPANIHMALNEVYPPGAPHHPALLWLRLPFQAVFMAWVWWATLSGPRGATDD